MKRILLRFESLQQVVGNEHLAVIMLTDEERHRAISVVCDEMMMQQIAFRMNHPDLCKAMLPEVLTRLLPYSLEMVIVGIFDGQYQVVLMDVENGCSERIRMSDAVLLNIISQTPLYIEENLMAKQCSPFDENAKGVAIPINTMATPQLKSALEQAVEEENYELASQLRDEINRRKR